MQSSNAFPDSPLCFAEAFVSRAASFWAQSWPRLQLSRLHSAFPGPAVQLRKVLCVCANKLAINDQESATQSEGAI